MSTHLGRVAVIGAHGKVARLLSPLLREEGYDVSGLVRSEAHLAELADQGADGVLLDIEHASVEEIADALVDHTAVVWSAGAGGGNPGRTYAVDRDAAIRSMDAASAAGASRYVMVSFSGSDPDLRVPEDNPFRDYQDAKIGADEHLRATGLDWTVLGPGTLTTDPGTGTVNPDARFRDGDESPRELVAQVALAVLTDPRAFRRTLVFGAGDVPIDDWLSSLD